MAVEVENTSQVEEFARVLKRRLWWILIPAGIIIIFGVSYAIIVPKKYVARARVMVHERPATRGQGSTSITAEGRVAAHKLKAPQLVKLVLKGMDWAEYHELPTDSEQAKYRKWVNKNITVRVPPMESKVQQQRVDISYSHTRADMAEQFLRALVSQWQKDVIAKHRRSLTEEFDQLTQARVDHEMKREQIAEILHALRKDNDIPPNMSDEWGRPRSQLAPAYDEVERLKKLLVDEIEDMENRKYALEHLVKEEAAMPKEVHKKQSTEPEVSSEELVEAESELAVVQAKLAKGRYGVNNTIAKPLFDREAQLRRTIDQLRNLEPKMEGIHKLVANTEKENKQNQIVNDEADFLRSERAVTATRERLDVAKKETVRLQGIYKEIRLEESKMAVVQMALQTTSDGLLKVGKMMFTGDGPKGTPFEELLGVEASDEPTEPNAWLISLFSVVVGLGVGLALAVAIEFSRNCFRSINDIAQAMEIPVLGAVNRIETRRQRYLKRVQKLAVSICMLLTMGIVGFTLWAWALDPSLLKPSVVQSIDRLREMLG
ncbi:MAG: hypothetical protein GY930_09090 [bacterium]|nr:hypothetical protein [bacterium]